MQQITDEEFELLNAAKRIRSAWGQVDGKLITHKGRQGRAVAEAALVELIRLAHACPDSEASMAV